uniref:Uncharacterized protein n=1 Tax=Salix viminalis TaxID=40686 RepID=A0A6N2KI60_SALVM
MNITLVTTTSFSAPHFCCHPRLCNNLQADHLYHSLTEIKSCLSMADFRQQQLRPVLAAVTLLPVGGTLLFLAGLFVLMDGQLYPKLDRRFLPRKLDRAKWRPQEMAGEVDQQGPRCDKGWKNMRVLAYWPAIFLCLNLVVPYVPETKHAGQNWLACKPCLGHTVGEMSRAEPRTFELTFVAFKNGIFVSKMAARNDRQFHLHYLCFLAIIHANLLSSSVSDQVQSCDSYLYHISDGLSGEQIASFYSAKSSNVEPITLKTSDYLLLEM